MKPESSFRINGRADEAPAPQCFVRRFIRVIGSLQSRKLTAGETTIFLCVERSTYQLLFTDPRLDRALPLYFRPEDLLVVGEKLLQRTDGDMVFLTFASTSSGKLTLSVHQDMRDWLDTPATGTVALRLAGIKSSEQMSLGHFFVNLAHRCQATTPDKMAAAGSDPHPV